MRAALSNTSRGFRGFATWSRRYYAPSHSDGTTTFPRLEALRTKLQQEGRTPLSISPQIFEVSQRGKDFLHEINSNNLNKKYSRGGKNGEGYVGVKEIVNLVGDKYYSAEEKARILEIEKFIQDRMRVKVSRSYLDHALKFNDVAASPNPILKIVMPDSQEVMDLTGEVDPSNQNRYSPIPGLLHKYEMLLAFVSINCSSHCRYCYRLDLFNGTSSKSKADMAIIAAYIKAFNSLIEAVIQEHGVMEESSGLWLHKETNERLIPIREILFSGGDPMTLPNSTLARYMTLMAEAGIKTIRIGTKELSFNPQRFDAKFWEMMDLFHETFPEVKLELVGHYSHPYELVDPRVDSKGNYLYSIDLAYRTREDIRVPISEIRKRSEWVGHHNQFPIISGVNDSAKVIRLLLDQSKRLGITLHNIYACREIIGSRHFRRDNTIEAQYELIERVNSGLLSGLQQNRARLIMSTEYGKVEVSDVDKKEGIITLKINRFIHGNKPETTKIKVDQKKLPEGQKFYWLTEDVIEAAVDEEGKKVLRELRNEDNSLIKKLKKAAATSVMSSIPQNDNEQQTSSCNQTVTIEVVNRNGGSKIIHVDLSDKKHKEKKPTLATILAAEGDVEAACKEQLSCSTCVVEDLESSNPLPEASEDELDLVDSAAKNAPSTSIKIRAGCEIPLAPGKYKLTLHSSSSSRA